MCGLVGMAGDIDKEDRQMFRQMLIVDAIRGHHSTGVASATPKKGEMLIFKKALNPVDFMQLRGFDQVCDWSSQILMGHNRYATVGKINNATAHPFEVEGVVGAHNGTLQQWYNLPDAKDFEVDSECLIHNIAVHGFKDTMPKVQGAFALTVYDENTHELHLLRNKERPMYFGYKEDRSVMYWASEAWMIRNMAARCGIKLAKQIQQPKEHMLLTWKMPLVKGGAMPDPVFTKLESFKQKKYEAPAQSYNRTYNQQRASCAYQGSPTPIGTPYRTVPNTKAYNGNSLIKGINIGNRIAFCPIQVQESTVSNAKFLEGITLEDPWAEVRVYNNTPGYIDKLCDDGMVIEGVVSAIAPGLTEKDDPYAVLSGHSIKQTTEGATMKGNADGVIELVVTGANDPDLVVYYPGPGGKLVEEDKWNDLTKHGCGYCTVSLFEESEITWVGDAPICPDCVTITK